MVSSEDEELPFWMYHNQRGRIEKETNFASWVSGKAFYDLGKAGKLEAGAGILARDAQNDKVFTDELYLTYTKEWLEFTVGRKQRQETYNGLSASNESILWSLNARPLPGLQLKTKRPVFIFKNFGFEASWEEYLMDDDRFVNNTRLHHKNLRFVYNNTERSFEIKVGIQHFVQWGGNSPLHGNQPEGFNDYIKLITGQSGNENAAGGDQLNALGNHLGGYEIYITKKLSLGTLELFYQHLFEDKSGRRLGNTPDGRYGAYLEFREKDKLISELMYELYYTKHQSHTTSGNHIWDNYFNNYLYRSGWTYHQQMLGAPFFLPNFYTEANSLDHIEVGNNKFIVHHFGLGGKILDRHYKLLFSYRNNYGHHNLTGTEYYPSDDPRGTFQTPKEVLSSKFHLQLLNSKLNPTLILGADFFYENFIGSVGINFRYEL